MTWIFYSYKDFLSRLIPLIAILISGIIDVEIFLSHPFDDLIKDLFQEKSTQEMMKRISWSLLQIFPAFIFGFFSDRYQRRITLFVSQILGVVGGILLWFFKFNSWIFFFLGLAFNPLSADIEQFQKSNF